MMKRILTKWSPAITAILVVLAAAGYYLGGSLKLKLSLTDLLPDKHPAVVQFEKLTEIVGGVGYFTIVLEAPDGESHLKIAPTLVAKLKESPLVRSAFYHREQKFFTDRVLYYVATDKLRDLDNNIGTQIKDAKKKVWDWFDLGLDDKKAEPKAPAIDEELKRMAHKSAVISPFLISKDKKHMLVMVKPSFDSMDLNQTKQLIAYAANLLKTTLPANVTYEFAERYYSKVVDTDVIQTDIIVLGAISLIAIALIIYLYMKSFRALLIIFVPVLLGMGLTAGVAQLFIGHINIITGFLMGIVSGLGVDYGIHLLLRLRLERQEPSSEDPDPVWRTLHSSGHSVFVGASAAALAFFLLCFSSFRAFSEFGFICGVGIVAVLICLMACFSALSRLFKLDVSEKSNRTFKFMPALPTLSLPRGFVFGSVATIVFIGLALKVEFEYDFNKMLKHSEKMEKLAQLVDDIYERSSEPSAISSQDKAEAIAVEKMIKDKYMPHLVGELISGATIVPEDQATKQKILQSIDRKIAHLKDHWIESALDAPASVVRRWVKAQPFTFTDLPPHVQDALRGTKQEGFLMYVYPAIKLNNINGVRTYAAMWKDVQATFPHILTGSDAVVFSDILDLIGHDGKLILAMIFVAVGFFIWLNVRQWDETLLCYIPLLISLPVGMGLMYVFGIKFNIFNIAIIPTFVAMGIDVPIHIVHRAKETGSGYKAAKDMAASINLALITAGVGFGVLVFARAGVLRSLGWIALLGSVGIWWVGLIVLPAFLEWLNRRTGETAAKATEVVEPPAEEERPRRQQSLHP